MWILDIQRKYRVSNKIQVSIGIEQNLVLNQHYTKYLPAMPDEWIFLFHPVELKQYFAKFGPVRSASIIFVSIPLWIL